ncbi:MULTISPECIES: hypothetical protein [unclassified Sphingomonas]|uniref:hypothetical protein n=1 Tax=unclassified Sphingomonas TaxID=196159 RepID=UPI0006FF5DD6|nr:MULTISPECIES: hypothetical protein [unclassified Sphingomonas]KQM58893.1 hypothetical protein ASE65_11100 [Sphingomonas sp. Leaf16]KQN11148.1 hypothetical protein ASE81_12090 [Sphingomonas sp. Leaf29]KQN18447.1 hypothetical protein ASE83_12015 [Sphingomonas sp. Leaf32]
MSDQTNQIVIADRDMLVRMWLTEAVATGKMTQAAADKHWKDYSDNWHTVANYFSATDDAMLIRKLVRETGIRGRCYFKSYNGKLHVVFKGYPGLRRVLTGTKYGALHPKVVGLGIGKAGVAKSAKGGTIVSVVLLTVWNIVDYVIRDEATLGQMLGGIAGDVSKALIAGGVGYAAGSAAVALGMTVAAGPLVIAVVVGLGVGWALDALDEKYRFTERLQKQLDEGIAELERKKQALVARGQTTAFQFAGNVIDLIRDAAIAEGKRQIRDIFWKLLPRYPTLR